MELTAPITLVAGSWSITIITTGRAKHAWGGNLNPRLDFPRLSSSPLFTVTLITSHPRLALCTGPAVWTISLPWPTWKDPDVTLVWQLLRRTQQTEFSCVNPTCFPLIHLSSLDRVFCAWARCPKFPCLSSLSQFLLNLCLYTIINSFHLIVQFQTIFVCFPCSNLP